MKPVLIAEDDVLQRQMLATLLRRRLDYDSVAVENGRAALDAIKGDSDGAIKIVILDLNMPVMGGIETLQAIRKLRPHMPVILLTGSRDVDDAVAAMKLGATDFITKPYEGERMTVTVRNALKLATMAQEISRLTRDREGRAGFDTLIGHDGGLAPVVAVARKAAATDIPVLLTGETGSGKEVFARAIHGESARGGKPFVAVNCGAIPSQLIESILFGHEKGAFTGANEKTIGKFREAEGGTIFLDEVGELPLEAQVKLLRVLQQHEIEPVGAGKTVPVNVRVISATNKNIADMVKAGKFREDLMFRLNVLEVHLPPLRARREDILPLAQNFISRFCAAEQRIPQSLTREAEDILVNHDWPGNVRELENAIRRALVLSDGEALGADHFSVVLKSDGAVRYRPADENAYIELFDEAGAMKGMNALEQEILNAALRHFDGNITQASKGLNLAKSTFYRKIKSGG